MLFAEIVSTLRAAGCVFAEDEADLLMSAATSPADLTAMVEQRVTGTPLEYIVGWAEFCGLRIAVDPGVFVPRRRTEFMVQLAASLPSPRFGSWMLSVAPTTESIQDPGGAVVVDMCCGSGAVGTALNAVLGDVELYAVDIDPAAVACARRNVEPVGGHVFEGDLFEPLPADLHGRVDIVVANAPYVPTDAIALMPPEARLYEARVALDGGSDGLDIQRRVAAEGSRWLRPGGHLLIETSVRQAPLTAEAFAEAGLTPEVQHSEELDGTVVIGRRP